MINREVEKIYRDIKEIKIQGATNIAKAAVRAYSLMPTKENKKKLISLRATEPMLANVLEMLEKGHSKEEILSHFEKAQDRINKEVIKILKKIKGERVVFVHCHSTNVIKALIYAWKKGVRFMVVNTETRPLYQGRKSAVELSKAGIRVESFVDSAMKEAINKSKVILLGADAILKDGVINKIGSGAIAELAKIHKKEIYVAADSWKFSRKRIKIEERKFNEVWKNAPLRVKVGNPAFEKIDKKLIKGIVSEFGCLGFEGFLRRMGK